ncbi:MAG: hypothetical protein IKU25_07525 [Clostridia bacterium]|nr:hypothetical protein [Clostridia bacterium]
MDYKNIPDSELASVMVNYINRIKHLKEMISCYLGRSDRGYVKADQIKAEYKELKIKLRDDADYLSLSRNRNGSILYTNAFAPSIREAAAFGFTVPVNAAVNQQMYSAVEEAHYKLRKYKSLEEWRALI